MKLIDIRDRLRARVLNPRNTDVVKCRPCVNQEHATQIKRLLDTVIDVAFAGKPPEGEIAIKEDGSYYVAIPPLFHKACFDILNPFDGKLSLNTSKDIDALLADITKTKKDRQDIKAAINKDFKNTKFHNLALPSKKTGQKELITPQECEILINNGHFDNVVDVSDLPLDWEPLILTKTLHAVRAEVLKKLKEQFPDVNEKIITTELDNHIKALSEKNHHFLNMLATQIVKSRIIQLRKKILTTFEVEKGFNNPDFKTRREEITLGMKDTLALSDNVYLITTEELNISEDIKILAKKNNESTMQWHFSFGNPEDAEKFSSVAKKSGIFLGVPRTGSSESDLGNKTVYMLTVSGEQLHFLLNKIDQNLLKTEEVNLIEKLVMAEELQAPQENSQELETFKSLALFLKNITPKNRLDNLVWVIPTYKKISFTQFKYLFLICIDLEIPPIAFLKTIDAIQPGAIKYILNDDLFSIGEIFFKIPPQDWKDYFNFFDLQGLPADFIISMFGFTAHEEALRTFISDKDILSLFTWTLNNVASLLKKYPEEGRSNIMLKLIEAGAFKNISVTLEELSNEIFSVEKAERGKLIDLLYEAGIFKNISGGTFRCLCNLLDSGYLTGIDPSNLCKYLYEAGAFKNISGGTFQDLCSLFVFSYRSQTEESNLQKYLLEAGACKNISGTLSVLENLLYQEKNKRSKMINIFHNMGILKNISGTLKELKNDIFFHLEETERNNLVKSLLNAGAFKNISGTIEELADFFRYVEKIELDEFLNDLHKEDWFKNITVTLEQLSRTLSKVQTSKQKSSLLKSLHEAGAFKNISRFKALPFVLRQLEKTEQASFLKYLYDTGAFKNNSIGICILLKISQQKRTNEYDLLLKYLHDAGASVMLSVFEDSFTTAFPYITTDIEYKNVLDDLRKANITLTNSSGIFRDLYSFPDLPSLRGYNVNHKEFPADIFKNVSGATFSDLIMLLHSQPFGEYLQFFDFLFKTDILKNSSGTFEELNKILSFLSYPERQDQFIEKLPDKLKLLSKIRDEIVFLKKTLAYSFFPSSTTPVAQKKIDTLQNLAAFLETNSADDIDKFLDQIAPVQLQGEKEKTNRDILGDSYNSIRDFITKTTRAPNLK